MTGKFDDKSGLSRRGLMASMAAAAGAVPLAAKAQAPAAPAAAPPAGGRGGRGAGAGRGPTPGGDGPIKVLFITKFHPFDREESFPGAGFNGPRHHLDPC